MTSIPRSSLIDRHQAVTTTVARHFGATVAQGAGTRDVSFVIGRKRIAVSATVIETQVPKRSKLKPPRLRFDRGVLRLLGDLRAAFQTGVPTGVTVVVTVTAPIRLRSKTTTALEERMRALLEKRSRRDKFTNTINDNQIQIRIIRAGKTATSKLAGFVHNRDSDPAVLFEFAQALLTATASVMRKTKGTSGERWLVLAIEDQPSWMATYRHVCAQLFAQTDFRRVVLVGTDGSVSTLES